MPKGRRLGGVTLSLRPGQGPRVRGCLMYCGAPVLFVLCTVVLPCCLSYVLWCSRVVCLMYCGDPVLFVMYSCGPVLFVLCTAVLPFLPGESHGQRNLVGCSPWGCKE